MIGGERLLEFLRNEARDTAGGLLTRFSVETRPKVAALLVEAGIVAIRKANGENTSTAEIALEAALANLSLQERNHVQIEAREMAFRALVALVSAAL